MIKPQNKKQCQKTITMSNKNTDNKEVLNLHFCEITLLLQISISLISVHIQLLAPENKPAFLKNI